MYIMTANGWHPLVCPCVNSNDLQGVYNPVSVVEARNANTRRCTQFTNDVSAYINGYLPKEQIFQAFDKPVYGAFGEKL